MLPKVKYVFKKQPFRKGDFITCWDDELCRTISGQVVGISKTEFGTYDLTIRWNDVFVAVERCDVTEAIKRIKMGLWKYKPFI